MIIKYWFKRSGGVPRPAALEGWITILVYLGILVLVLWEVGVSETLPKDILVREAPTVFVATVALLYIVLKKS